MTKIDFALWDGLGAYSSSDVNIHGLYEDHLALAREIDEAGWHSYFVIEHQNAPIGRITSPATWLTAVARETTNLRLGAMMWQLPFYHPIRLAQEVAMLDQISKGRVEFGSGIGVHEHEFIRWNVDFYKRGPIAEEVLKIVKMAWTQDEVTFEGEYFKFDEALPQPRPYQKPYPPIWAAVHSDAAMEWAARNNYHVAQNIDTDETIARKFDIYRKAWREANHAGEMPRVFLQRQVHVAETDELAHEQARKYILSSESNAVVTSGGKIANTRIGWGSHARAMGRDSERPDDKARGETLARAKKDYQFSLDTGLAVVGSPDTVIRVLEESKAKIGYDIFCANHEVGAMPRDMVRKSIKLFSDYVVPAFKK